MQKPLVSGVCGDNGQAPLSLSPFLTASSGASQTDNTVALVGGVVAVVVIVAVAVVVVVVVVALLRKRRSTDTYTTYDCHNLSYTLLSNSVSSFCAGMNPVPWPAPRRIMS